MVDGCAAMQRADGEERRQQGGTGEDPPELLLVMEAEPLETTLLVVVPLLLLDRRGADRVTSVLVPLPLATPKSTAVGLPSQLPAASTNCAPALEFVKPCTRCSEVRVKSGACRAATHACLHVSTGERGCHANNITDNLCKGACFDACIVQLTHERRDGRDEVGWRLPGRGTRQLRRLPRSSALWRSGLTAPA